MFVTNFLIPFLIIMGLIFLARYLTRKKKSKAIMNSDGSAKTELDEAIASFKDAKEHFASAEEKVDEEKDVAKERLEEAEDLRKEIDNKKSSIT